MAGSTPLPCIHIAYPSLPRDTTDVRARPTPPGRPQDPARALAFAMALHGRLGRASPARGLDDALARHVAADLTAAPPARRVRL